MRPNEDRFRSPTRSPALLSAEKVESVKYLSGDQIFLSLQNGGQMWSECSTRDRSSHEGYRTPGSRKVSAAFLMRIFRKIRHAFQNNFVVGIHYVFEKSRGQQVCMSQSQVKQIHPLRFLVLRRRHLPLSTPTVMLLVRIATLLDREVR